MGRQASKRNRELYGLSQRRSPYRIWNEMQKLADQSKPAAVDERIWINRTVYGQSVSELKDVSRLIDREEARAKFVRFTLSVVTSREVYTAINKSGRHGVSPALIAERLFQGFPESAKRGVVAETSELKQFGNFLAVEAHYDSFREERTFISEYLSDALGIDHVWRTNPHITIARGALGRISNLEEVNEAIPQYVQLGPVRQN